MDGILNNKIKKWIFQFNRSNLRYDSYHIDELFARKCLKNEWIDCAWECYRVVETICDSYSNIHVLLVFYLNNTLHPRPHPKVINRHLFNNIDTPPEIVISKVKNSMLSSNIKLIEELSDQYFTRCYYEETQDEMDSSYWHYLYFFK